jgi:ribonuclease HI
MAFRGPCVVATDASFKIGSAGWGYVAANGAWGLSGGAFGDQLDPTGPSAAAVNELRAIHMALGDLEGTANVVILADSEVAVRYLAEWRSGSVAAMPPGYDLRRRTGAHRASSAPTLVQLAQTVRQRRELRFRHVHGHHGHALNEAADALAKLARRCISGEQDGDEASLTARATDLADSFLRAWHQQAAG